MISRAKTARARLCGRRDRRARSRAAATGPAGQRELLAVDHDRRSGSRGDLLPVPDGGGHHPGHADPALDRGGPGRLGAGGADAGVQVADGGQQHAGLAQRRQHLPDVAQEGGVRADHEHAALLQLAAVGVEQVGGPVQGHGGLAGAGPALDHQHPVQAGPDDVVLLGLDGLDDVGHRAGAGWRSARPAGPTRRSGPRAGSGRPTARSSTSSSKLISFRSRVLMCRRTRTSPGEAAVAR